jgi:TIR domain
MDAAGGVVALFLLVGFFVVVGVSIAVTGKTPWQLLAPSRPKSARAVESGNDGIFISYRRQDEPNFAGRLYDRLVAQFGKSKVFIDIDTIDLGLDFVDVIDRSLAQCKALIVVIGKTWLHMADAEGVARLSDPDDYVRVEIETALARQIRVIPVLVEGAAIPKSSELPEGMASLARRNSITMSHASFSSDADRLIQTLDRILQAKSS